MENTLKVLADLFRETFPDQPVDGGDYDEGAKSQWRYMFSQLLQKLHQIDPNINVIKFVNENYLKDKKK